MADTFTQLHFHVVFAVQNRKPSLKTEWRQELYKYMTGVIQNHGHKLITIGGVEDHVHILFDMRPTESLSNLIMELKRDSSKWIHQRGFVKGSFRWQAGYGAFSVSYSVLHNVCNYIEHQEEHHKRTSSKEEEEKIIKMCER